MSKAKAQNKSTGKLMVKEIHRISDPGPLTEIVFKNFSELASKPHLQHNRDEIRRVLTNHDFVGFFVYENGKVVAYLIGEKKHLQDGRLVYYITYIFVGGKYRNKKIASRLIEKLIERCEGWGIGFILLTFDIKDQRLLQFYTKRGFQPDPILKNGTQHEVYSLYV